MLIKHTPLPEIVTDRTDNDNESDVDGSMTENEEETVQDFSRKITLDTNGFPCGWLDLKPSFMNAKYAGNVPDLWKAWQEARHIFFYGTRNTSVQI
jgi:hypothetical protein